MTSAYPLAKNRKAVYCLCVKRDGTLKKAALKKCEKETSSWYKKWFYCCGARDVQNRCKMEKFLFCEEEHGLKLSEECRKSWIGYSTPTIGIGSYTDEEALAVALASSLEEHSVLSQDTVELDDYLEELMLPLISTVVEEYDPFQSPLKKRKL